MLPFTRAQFTAVFADYNAAVWPMQVLAFGLGLLVVVKILWRSKASSRVITLSLAAMWLWTGVFYHLMFFSAINPVATLFGAVFVLQSVLLCTAAVRNNLSFSSGDPGNRLDRGLGWALLAYAIVFYPLAGRAVGQQWADMPAFGLTPCPVTLATIGVFLLADPPLPRSLLWIPVGWTLIGGSAAALLDMPQDSVLLLVPLLLVGLMVQARRHRRFGAAHRTQRAPEARDEEQESQRAAVARRGV
jgi:hypothetical protein